jgi:hypothetical protein
MKTSSFSVGISDLISDDKTKGEIIEVITKKKTDVKNLIDRVQIGIFENNTGKTNEEEFETQVNNILNKATDESGKIGREKLSKNNGFVTMVNSGSKGSDLNISFMISCLGQQNVDGKRIPYGFEHRTLPHFNKYDDSPSARGFVESSYINGLSPQELLSSLNYLTYATANPYKPMSYSNYKTHADKYLDEDNTKLSSDDIKLHGFASAHYPQLTKDQIDTNDCLNFGSSKDSCFQSAQLFSNKNNNFNILSKGVNEDNTNLIIKEYHYILT